MQRFEQTAIVSIGRAVFFAGLAISLLMMGFAYDYASALRAGALLSIGLSAVLLWFAKTADPGKLEKCETWMLLAEKDRPANPASRAVLATVLRDTYLYFSVRAFAFSLAMFAGFAVLRIAGIEKGLG